MGRRRHLANAGDNDLEQAPRRELARTLLALADPIRLRMLKLMFAGALCHEQFAKLLGIDEKTVSKHLVFFREGKVLAVAHTRKDNTKYYTVRRGEDYPYFRLLELALELLDQDPVLWADEAAFRNLHMERLGEKAEVDFAPLERDDELHPPLRKSSPRDTSAVVIR